MKKFLLTAIATILFQAVSAQKKNAAFRIHIKRTTETVVIDGEPTDKAWMESEVATDFFMVLPMDKGKAMERSEIRMTYDENNLYLLGIFYKEKAGRYFVESLRRDFQFGRNDNFLLFLDPFNNQTTGFSFGSNAAGAQWDGTMHSGGNVDLNWDSKWISAVEQLPDRWIFEMAVPFKSIRYESGVTEWGINFSRLELESSEKSSWTPIPRQFPTASLAYTGVLVWDNPPPDPGANISVIPYVSASLGELSGMGKDEEVKAGGDMKFSIGTALNLDLTVNPDFSQVEVDRQVTNLDRFELFFPEKRQFFLENGDLFANFGYPTIRPFFSRRIGLGVPIHAGARLSGNLDKKWRVGLMDMQTASVAESGMPARNFGVLSLQRKVFGRSNINLLLVNQAATRYPVESDSLKSVYSIYNRNLGVEYNLASPNNLWTGKAFALKSFSPGDEGDGFSTAAHLEYKSREWNIRIQQEFVEESYAAEVGFVPRTGYLNSRATAAHLFFPRSEFLVSHGPEISGSFYWDTAFNRTDNQTTLGYGFNFLDGSNLAAKLTDEYVMLQSPFDPTRTSGNQLTAGTDHHWNALVFEYNSKPKSTFTYNLGGYLGGYYADGERISLLSEIGYRFQPFVNLSTALSYNNIRLPAPWHTTEFWLVGSEVDITFTNKLFLATLFQYNEQADTFNLNARFQWRYKPASDIFLVYTRNEFLENMQAGSWSLTFKLLYWLNI